MSNDFFELIKQDHEDVKELLEQITDLEEDETPGDLFQELKEKFIPHMKAEETTFYEVLMTKDEGRKTGMEAIEEHHVAGIVFEELEKLDQGEERWRAKMKVFKELVEHHIEEEESTVFDAAESALSDDELEDIRKRFEAEKDNIKGSLK